MITLEKYSIGTGDRFGRQGQAQLQAAIGARAAGIDLAIVWNKSHREHNIIGTQPASVRAEADAAVQTLGWDGAYHVDADHIGIKTVDTFMDHSDFFTIDVADFIGEKAEEEDMESFTAKFQGMKDEISGIEQPVVMTKDFVRAVAEKYLKAVSEAGRIYRHIEAKKGKGGFIPEISMDETNLPQLPAELLLILAMIAREGVPIQTIAPKFSGRFNKGVDYAGDLRQFAKEFEQDLCVIRHAIGAFGLPPNLKLSVHSGSDKFSLYPLIHKAIKKHGAGLHIKTAGTTWLEEVIGLAASDGNGLTIAKRIYRQAYERREALSGPYATVIDIDPSQLPSPDTVETWTANAFAETFTHDPGCPRYNAHARQLVHIAFKVAAEMGNSYLEEIEKARDVIGKNVTHNLLERHIKPIFGQ